MRLLEVLHALGRSKIALLRTSLVLDTCHAVQDRTFQQRKGLCLSLCSQAAQQDGWKHQAEAI